MEEREWKREKLRNREEEAAKKEEGKSPKTSAKPNGFEKVIVEKDLLQITQALRSSSIDLLLVGHFMEDSKALSSGIIGVLFTHIRCQANEVAHLLAQFIALACGLKNHQTLL
ncbi:unnamed protein product [Malus baccata var. baccata]